MFRKIVSTTNDPTLTVLRLVLGVVFFAHGAQKMLGSFGGYGFSGTMGFFTQQMGIPAPFAFLAIAAEFFGSLGSPAWISGTHRCLRYLVQHARGRSASPPAFRLFHELVQRPEGRGI